MSLPQTTVQQRVTLVDATGSTGDGDSLAGQNVNHFPEGALFYVRATNRFYTLVKNLPVDVVSVGDGNIVDGIGSSAVNGRFVACQQVFEAALTAGAVTISGAYLPSAQNNLFLISLVNTGGTQGFVRGIRANDHQITLSSSQGADTGTYVVVVVPAGT
jgi:hypothetical protein